MPHVGRCYCRKAAIGPLSLAAYVRDIAGLHAKYLGITENKAEKPQDAWIRPAVAGTLLCVLLFAGAQLTENAYESEHPKPPPTPRAGTRSENIPPSGKVSSRNRSLRRKSL